LQRRGRNAASFRFGAPARIAAQSHGYRRMYQDKPAWVAHQRAHWLRPDAHLFVRPDACRFMPPGAPRLIGKDAVRYFWPDAPSNRREPALDHEHDPHLAAARASLLALKRQVAALAFKLKFRRLLREKAYNPDQPRVPAGNPDGGQWTSEGSGSADRSDPRVISDATPDNEAIPRARYAQGRRRGAISVRIGNRVVEVEGGQAARLVEAEARARDATDRVRELDPSWRPTPSVYESVEGLIRTYEAQAREAQARASELASIGIGAGPFARESIPARGASRDLRTEERSRLNEIGYEWGCHTCGTLNPGTSSGNFVGDHQPPSALNLSGRSQRLFPQCADCSAVQGGWVRSLFRRR
jgi:hypothetical protein